MAPLWVRRINITHNPNGQLFVGGGPYSKSIGRRLQVEISYTIVLVSALFRLSKK